VIKSRAVESSYLVPNRPKERQTGSKNDLPLPAASITPYLNWKRIGIGIGIGIMGSHGAKSLSWKGSAMGLIRYMAVPHLDILVCVARLPRLWDMMAAS
jgi:hypothetical protein